MLHFFGTTIGLAITAAATLFGFWQARQFTQNKLRFVDGVHRPSVPVIAGVAAAAVAGVVTLFLPLVGIGTAILFGTGVALGVNSGARQIRKRLGAG